MNIKPFQAIYPRMSFITSADHFFSNVREEYNEYKSSGFFDKTADEGIFAYQIQAIGKSFIGLVCIIDINDYLEGRIKKHENTLASKEQQQMHLMLKRGAQVKPVLLTYPKVAKIQKLLKKVITEEQPIQRVEFDESNQTHTFWKINDGKIIQKIQELFKDKVPATYIADGHHRTSTTALMYDRTKGTKDEKAYDQLLCALFPTTELEIMDFNRVVEIVGDFSPALFMAQLSKLCNIDVLPRARKPLEKREMTLFLDRTWFSLKWRPEILKALETSHPVLDASLLNEKILQELLYIKDVKTDNRVKYVEGPAGLDGVMAKVMKGENRMAFMLYPVDMHDFIAISDVGKTLPPKSTWFEPRIKNGLIVKEF